MKRLSLVLLICALGAFGLAACGGDDEGDNTTEPATTGTTSEEATGGGGGKTVRAEADPGGALKFTQDTLSAPTGGVTFEFRNPSSTPHDFVLEDDAGKELAKTDVISDDTDTAKATLEAGEYTYFCSVPGHRDAGMEGTLTAK
jgi:plastocyanin